MTFLIAYKFRKRNRNFKKSHSGFTSRRKMIIQKLLILCLISSALADFLDYFKESRCRVKDCIRFCDHESEGRHDNFIEFPETVVYFNRMSGLWNSSKIDASKEYTVIFGTPPCDELVELEDRYKWSIWNVIF